jgi:hypothetical protein
VHEPGLSVTSTKRFVTPEDLNWLIASRTSKENWIGSPKNEPTYIYRPEEMLSARKTEVAGTRTTPVLFPGKMNDLMTPVLPLVGARVGEHEPGSVTAVCPRAPRSLSSARARPSWLWAARLLLDRRSTPFVSLFAMQLLAQLEYIYILLCQFASEDQAVKTY